MFDFLQRCPDFLILGAQKAGTSALESFLSQHPRISCAKRKEVGFFNRDKFYYQGRDWYARRFPRRLRPGLLLFEATPEYLYYPFVAERIFQFNPRLRLIALLRNPIDRAFSAWNMFRQLHGDPRARRDTIKHYVEEANPEAKAGLLELLGGGGLPDFHHCVETEIELLGSGRPRLLEPSFVRRGIYWEQIERYYSRFPHEQILVLESRELKTDRQACLNRVLNFLGLPESNWERSDLQDRHVRPYTSGMEDRTRKLLQQFFAPHNERLHSLLGRKFDWDAGDLKSAGQ